MVDIRREGRSQRSAPRRHTEHLKQACPLPPRKPSNWYWRGDKMYSPNGETMLAKRMVT